MINLKKISLIAISLLGLMMPPSQKDLHSKEEFCSRKNNIQATQIDKKYYLIFDKSDQRLYLIENQKIKKSYPAAYGAEEGVKEKEGDCKTPEGKYQICYINPESYWHFFMGINYPNIEDAKNGLKKKLINKQEYNQIIKAYKNGERPPWNTKLGGEIGIHGIPTDSPELEKITQNAPYSKQNWTVGCMGLTNNSIDELKEYVGLGTCIIIRK